MKQINRNNYRVVTEVPDWRAPGRDIDETHKAMISDCQQLEAEIKRHCDGGDTEIKWDTEYTCSHCGYNWETEEDGLPICCDEAQKEFRNETKS